MGFSDPGTNAAWAVQEGYPFELWTDHTRALALAYGAVDAADEESPLRHALVLDAEGRAVLFFAGAVSVGPYAEDVLHDAERWFAR